MYHSSQEYYKCTMYTECTNHKLTGALCFSRIIICSLCIPYSSFVSMDRQLKYIWPLGSIGAQVKLPWGGFSRNFRRGVKCFSKNQVKYANFFAISSKIVKKSRYFS